MRGFFAELTRERMLKMFWFLCLTRAQELKIRYDAKESNDKKIGTISLLSLGEEAISLGVAFACDPKIDWLAPSHRSKGALLYFGVTPKEDFANHMLKADSPSKGRDGNIHYGCPDRHIIRFISHMCANLPAAVGVAEGLKRAYMNRDHEDDEMGFVLCFCGDGASSQG